MCALQSELERVVVGVGKVGVSIALENWAMWEAISARSRAVSFAAGGGILAIGLGLSLFSGVRQEKSPKYTNNSFGIHRAAIGLQIGSGVHPFSHAKSLALLHRFPGRRTLRPLWGEETGAASP